MHRLTVRIIVGIACALVLAMGSLLWVNSGFHQPSEKSLERRFSERRAAFDLLSELKLEDNAIDVVYARTESNSGSSASRRGVSRARLNEYGAVFTTTGVKYAMSWGSGDIYLDVWSSVFVHGTHLGYIHCGLAEPTRAEAIGRWPYMEGKESGSGQDNSEDNGFEYSYQYKRIAPNWYILKANY